ncbi:MAG TPA: peptidase domain-containing ABC transporter [Burkholderiaceae bacterium]|nr:peptidase domain-containing ABC transporter [Burkholderiaceae bacterium]
MGYEVDAGEQVAASLAEEGVASEPDQGCLEAVLSASVFVEVVGAIAKAHHIAIDEALVLQQFVAPYTSAQVHEALDALGLDVMSVPALALARDGFASRAGDYHGAVALAWWRAPGVDGSEAPMQPVLLQAMDEAQVLLFAAGQADASAPRRVPRAQLMAQLCGVVVLAHARCQAPKDHGSELEAPGRTPATDEAGAKAGTRPFGFRWFVPELLRHQPIWRDVLLASATIQILALGMPLMTQAIIDKVVVHRTQSTLIALGIGLALFTVFTAGFTWLRQRLILHTGVRIDAVLSNGVFAHLLHLPPRYFQQRPTGVIAARLHGIESIREFLSSAAISLILDLPFLSVALAVMFTYSVTLTLIALGILALIALASLVVAPIFQAKLNREFLLGARNQGFMTEYIAGMDTVKSLQMEPLLKRRFGDYQAAYLNAGFETRQVANTYNTIASALEQSMSLLILIFGAWLVMRPREAMDPIFTIGMLVAFQMFAARLSQPVMRLVGLWQQFQQARLSVLRLGDLMNAPPEPYRLLPSRCAQPDRERQALIEVRQLAFRFGEDRPYLYENLNMRIEAGQCVALMGPSGSGKSTLARLMQGFYPIERGAILASGIDTRHMAANELRSLFGVVPQETVLFSGTVLDNLLAAAPRASFEQVVSACVAAEIHEVIEALPQGYRTEIGERGAGLSGGQRQRIAIARALLKNPQVLIFDEATSNLDPETAENFARTVARLRGTVAIVFITHAPPRGLTFDHVVHLRPPGGVAPAPRSAQGGGA